MPSTSFSESVDLLGFEGAEKKMEIIFSPMKKSDNKEGLRSYGLDHWSSVVKNLNGSIIRNDTLEAFDSYLISESSLFVYWDRVIILTCGTTTLLKALPSILESAKNIDMDVNWFQFSRKNFLYPEEQLFPHKSFDQEVKYCSEMFSDGQAHILGPINGDHWYVFVADRMQQFEICDQSGSEDQTLNIYMYGIRQEVAQLFMKSEEMILPSIFDTKESVTTENETVIKKDFMNKKTEAKFTFVTSAAEATKRSGIDMLMTEHSGRVVHDHLFDPCGYSMNGVAGKDRYWTIHITPEAHCSYISFETNFSPQSYHSLVSKVLRTFQPLRATVVIQADKFAPVCVDGCLSSLTTDAMSGYSILAQSVTKVADEYTVHLVNYEASDSSTDGTWTCSSQSSID